MQEVISYFKEKKNLINALVLGILILALPLGVNLVRTQQIFFSRAATDPIKFSGQNVEVRAGKVVATKNQVNIELISPLGPPAGAATQTTLDTGGLVKEAYAQCTTVCNPVCDGPPTCRPCGSAYEGECINTGGADVCDGPPSCRQDCYQDCSSTPNQPAPACNTSCCIQAGGNLFVADGICRSKGAAACDPNNPFPDSINPWGDGCLGYQPPPKPISGTCDPNANGGADFSRPMGCTSCDTYLWGCANNPGITHPFYEPACSNDPICPQSGGTSPPPSSGNPPSTDPQYSTCGSHQVTNAGYDYCNDPYYNGGQSTGGIYACEIFQGGANFNPVFGDGCYVANGTTEGKSCPNPSLQSCGVGVWNCGGAPGIISGGLCKNDPIATCNCDTSGTLQESACWLNGGFAGPEAQTAANAGCISTWGHPSTCSQFVQPGLTHDDGCTVPEIIPASSACWVGGGNVNSGAADTICGQTHPGSTKCEPTVLDTNTTFDDGCSKPTAQAGTCNVTASATNIQTGGKIRWTVTSEPAGKEAKWFGSNIEGGVTTPVNGSPVQGFSNTTSWSEEYTYNNPGQYSRTVAIYDSNGAEMCKTTNPVSVTVTGTASGQTPSVIGFTLATGGTGVRGVSATASGQVLQAQRTAPRTGTTTTRPATGTTGQPSATVTATTLQTLRPGNVLNYTVTLKDAGHADVYYILAGASGTGGTNLSTGTANPDASCSYPPCTQTCVPVMTTSGVGVPSVPDTSFGGKQVLDDGCWLGATAGAGFTTTGGSTIGRSDLFVCPDGSGRPVRYNPSVCRPITCTNFNPSIHYSPNDACVQQAPSVLGVSTISQGQVLQAQSTGGNSGGAILIKTLPAADSGKPQTWTIPQGLADGRYQLLVNAHKNTTHGGDWVSPDKGCAWDGQVYQFNSSGQLARTNEACNNAGPREFRLSSTGTGGTGGTGSGTGPGTGTGTGAGSTPGGSSRPTGSNIPSGSNRASPPAGSTAAGTIAVKIAESAAGLSSAQTVQYTSEPLTISNYAFKDVTPGKKTIWVEFIGSATGSTARRSADIDLLPPTPTITGCSTNPIGNNVEFEIKGFNFGTEVGSIKSGNNSLSGVNWSENLVKGTLNNAPTGQAFPLTLTRKDGQSIDGQCSSVSSVFFSGKLFCPQVSKALDYKADLIIKETTGSAQPRKEKITISGGIIKDLQAKLQEGVAYRIAVKVEKGLRKIFNVVGEKGTTHLNEAVLPLGDICPVPADGHINSIDYSCLKQQWGPVTGNENCDLNGDKVCNSFEWACTRGSFGKSDDPEP